MTMVEAKEPIVSTLSAAHCEAFLLSTAKKVPTRYAIEDSAAQKTSGMGISSPKVKGHDQQMNHPLLPATRSIHVRGCENHRKERPDPTRRSKKPHPWIAKNAQR